MKILAASIVVFLVAVAAACEFNPQAELKGGNPPSFSIWSGTGNLLLISIHEYRVDKATSSEQMVEVWRVEAARNGAGQVVGRRPSDIDNLTYGVVPEGYRQIVPASGNAPSLLEGRVYSYEFATKAGMPAHGDFEIRKGMASKVRVPHNCIVRGDGDKKIDTPCTYYNE